MKQESKYEENYQVSDDKRVTLIVNVARAGILITILSLLSILPATIGYSLGVVTLVVAVFLALRWFQIQQRYK